MKSFFAILAVAATVAVASAAPCEIVKLSPLLTDTDVKQCTADTSFQPPIPPTADMMPKVCKSTACTAALGKLKALSLGDCTVGAVALETNLIGPIEKACGGGASAGAGATTTAPAAGNNTATTTPKPAGNDTATTTPKPAGNGTTTTAPTTSAPVTVATKAPVVTNTTAPTPAPTKSAAFATSQASSVLLGSSLVAVVYMAAN